MIDTHPIVVIKCLVYNHEPYLRDCLDGFVMQKTNFLFVAIVHDDCSTDKSADIIREYAEKYPNVIKPIYETENQYSKHDGSLKRVIDTALVATGAKYIAMCEGDDYWTDPYKLQKQVEYMEEHEDCVICAHNAYQHFSNNAWGVFVNPNYREHDVDLKEMLMRWHIPTASLIYRKETFDKVPATGSYPNGDYYLMLRLMSQGNFHYNPAIMSVYRMHDDSVSAEMSRNKLRMYDDIVRLLNGVRQLYNVEEQPLFDEAISRYETMKLDFIRSSDPVKKWFYGKTYTRLLKKLLRSIIN